MSKSRKSGKGLKRSRAKRTRVKKSSLKKVVSKTPIDVNNIMARCMKCRKQMKMNDAKQVVLKNGRNAMKGICVCGTKMFKFV
jgi:hypothetical protein